MPEGLDAANVCTGCNAEVPAVVVLREHVLFLREQLAEKNTWHQQALEKERDEAMGETGKLQVALAQLIQEVWFHNTDANGNGGYQTPNEWLGEFERLLP